VPIVGDVKGPSSADLIEALRKDGNVRGDAEHGQLVGNNLRGVQSTFPLSYGPQSDGRPESPNTSSRRWVRLAGPDALYVAGVGQHQMWGGAVHQSTRNPRTWLNLRRPLAPWASPSPRRWAPSFARPDAEVWGRSTATAASR